MFSRELRCVLLEVFKNVCKFSNCSTSEIPQSPHFTSLHLSLDFGGHWGTTDDFTTSFLGFSLFSTALWDLANSRPVHSLMLSSHIFCLPCLLPPFTVPCKMVLTSSDERETCTYHFSFRLFTMVRRSLCGPIACWILIQTSSSRYYASHTITTLPTRKPV